MFLPRFWIMFSLFIIMEGVNSKPFGLWFPTNIFDEIADYFDDDYDDVTTTKAPPTSSTRRPR